VVRRPHLDPGIRWNDDLTGVISDQAELHGMLIKIRDLGVTLISVALVEPPTRVDSQL